NQLVAISGPSMNASFVYDGLGRRQKKTINSNLTEFLYDGVNPVQETSGAAVLANILPGLGIDEFLSRTDVVAGTTSHLLADALGSSIALTDASGAVQTDYTFEPFGRTTATGLSSTNPFQYTGRENDGTGLHYYRARYYNAAFNRFLAEDPLPCEQRKGISLYAYVSNNPINLTDPSGLAPRTGGTREACNYYDDRCKPSSKTDESRDEYACKSARCCRDFGEGLQDRCVRQCLISNDELCADLTIGRGYCRFSFHLICYTTCLRGWWGIPPSCDDVKWG
ncbi:MAG: RHS repeat-associated core domain-containing protein, partial [Deltaproteobacteria bacterium]|nr:RHS repeat-associated core domain-containing protein [Deltaproteobacteria bacterium]